LFVRGTLQDTQAWHIHDEVLGVWNPLLSGAQHMQAREIPLDVTSSVTQFWAAHDEALFAQPVLVALTGLSASYFERARWEGGGPRFLKFGRLVRYRKADVVDWINQRQPVASTSEIGSGRLIERPA
jgi:predicted DNA-binding transcriptional regulator AlpA